jgi:methylmalonyl-CoA/ethylmalonyl-CoA epimerase
MTERSSSARPVARWSLGQIALPARDLDRAIAFYRDTLGMLFLFNTPSLAFFDCDGIRLMIGLPKRTGESAGASIHYFRVPDLPATYEALRSRGVTFIDQPHPIATMPDHELWMVFHDSEGNVVGLMSEVR